MSGRLRRVFKRHFFIIGAACVLGLMVVAAVLKIALGDGDASQQRGPGGPGGARGQVVAEVVDGAQDLVSSGVDEVRSWG